MFIVKAVHIYPINRQNIFVGGFLKASIWRTLRYDSFTDIGKVKAVEKEKIFEIERKSLYMEAVFVEYENDPIYFLCKSDGEYFLCLCIDVQKERYVVVKTNKQNILNMLCGKITMRRAITCENVFWAIKAQDDIAQDIVEKHDMKEIDDGILPQEDATFKLVTPELMLFRQKLENELYSDGVWETMQAGEVKADLFV